MCECVRAPSQWCPVLSSSRRSVGRWRVHVRVRVYVRSGRSQAMGHRPEVLPRGADRSDARGRPSGRSVSGYVIPKVGRSASVPPSPRMGRSSVSEV